MVDMPQITSDSLSVSALLAIDKICRQFEAELKAGNEPQMDAYLGGVPDPQRSELRRELESIQREYGQKSGHHASLAQFVQNLVASGLMTEDQVQTVLDEQPPNQRPQTGDELAELLHRQGRLTRFQARAVYQGKTRGLVLGNYVVLDKLGRGGMGQVFKAQHRRMDRIVALKMLPAAMMRAPEAVKRFQREAKAAAKLSNPNIVTAYDADEASGVHFLVMEYVEGRDLGSLVKEHGPLSVATAVDYVLQAARGLEYAHRQGVVHRDIKPANVLVDAEGTVKVLDMGLARVESATAGEDALTHTGQVMGTLDFMSPEQALDTRHVDGRTDIYSLGCTLYYLLTGRPPYGGDTMTKKILAHRQEPVPSLCEARPDVPAALDTAFRQMLAKDPGQRQASMAEVVAQLRRFGVTAPAGPPPLPRPVAPLAETQSVTADHVADTATGETPEISLNRPVVTPHEARDAGSPLVSEAIRRLARQDYAGVIELLGAVPAEQRSAEAEQLLKQAQDLRAEVEQLNERMTHAVRDRQYEGLREDVLARLLEIEPGNLTARDLYEHLGTYSPGEALRFDKDGTLLPADLRQGWAGRFARLVYQRLTRRRATAARPRSRRPGEPARGSDSGSDLPWVPLAIGLGVLAIAGLLLGIVFLLRDGDQTVRVEIDPALVGDANVTVWLDGKRMEIAGVGETITLKPGEHGYEIRRGDELIAAREFTVLKGDNSALQISTAAMRPTQVGPEAELEAGFVSLFDGKTLSGWEGPADHYFVENGLLVSDFSGRRPGDHGDKDRSLMSVRQYDDFVLRFDFRVQAGGNSGMLIRAPRQEVPPSDRIEIQIVDDYEPRFAETFRRAPTQLTGSIALVAPAEAGKLKTAGAWNHLEIKGDGRHVNVELNGARVLDVDLDSFGQKNARGEDHPGLSRPRGHLGLIGPSSLGRVEYRNIRIKELSTQATGVSPGAPGRKPTLDSGPRDRLSAGPTGRPRWFGCDVGDAADRVVADVAPFANLLWDHNWTTRGEQQIQEARRFGLKIVFALQGREEFQSFRKRGVPLVRKNRDVVIGIGSCCPPFFGVEPAEVSEFAREIKLALPGIQYCVSAVDSKKCASYIDSPEVDVLLPECIYASADDVRSKAEAHLTDWIAAAKGRPLIPVLTHAPKDQAGTYRAYADVAEKHKLAGMIVAPFSDSHFGNRLYPGLRARSELVAEIRQIGESWCKAPPPAIAPQE